MFLRIYTERLLIRAVLLYLACFLFVNGLQAQEQITLNPQKKLVDYSIRNWDAERGMPSDASVQILQNSQGYIWVATYNGAARFDGQRFTILDQHSNPRFDLSEQIQNIAEDWNGALWFGTLQGVVGYENNRFFVPPALDILQKTIVETLSYDTLSQRLWIGVVAHGLYSYDGVELVHYPELFSLTKATIQSIYADGMGAVWIGTEGGEIIRYSKRVFEKIGSSKIFGKVSSFYSNRKGRVWITTDDGLYFYEMGKLSHFSELPIKNTTAVLEDASGSLWIGSQSGLYRYNMREKLLENLNEDNGFPSNMVRDIAVDRQGSLWIATYRKGIVQITDGPVFNVSKEHGLRSSVIVGIAEYEAGTYLVGHESGVIDRIKDGTITPFRTKKSIPKDRLKHIMVDSHKTIWVSTYGGLVRIDNNGYEHVYNLKNGFPSDAIRLTYEDKSGNIWVGTRSEGLFCMNREGDFLHTFNQTNGFASNYIMAIVEDLKGRMVISTKNGIHIIENNRIDKILSTADGLPSGFSFNIHVDADNILWVASNDGLIRIENDTLITVFNTSNGLFNNAVYDVLEDKTGNLWLPTVFGVVRLNKQLLERFVSGEADSYSQRVFGKSDGMKTDNCVGATKSMISSEGVLFFTTAAGIAVIVPWNSEAPDEFQSVLFETMQADADEFYPTAKGFSIPAGHKRFQFFFTSLNLLHPDRIQFRYKLEPFDSDWIVSSAARSASYTNLQPGNYTFTVKLMNRDGEWSQESFSIPVRIEASWYQTIWFVLLSSLFLATLIWLLYKLRIRSIKFQKLNLEKLVNERTALILDQKREMEKQAKTLELFSIVASHTNNAILITNKKGEIQWINDAFSKLYQYNLDEYIEHKGNTIFKVSANPDIAYVVDSCRETLEPVSYTEQVVQRDGKKVWVLTTLTPILDANGKLRNFVAIDTDITLLKDAEEEMISMGEEILAQTEELSKQRDELEDLNSLLINQKENVEASIRYAKTIQSSILPDPKTLSTHFDSFVIFKPRDIVSGDFYWYHNLVESPGQNSKFLLAVVDCTGHGVPGAFMSLIGNRLLDEIVSNHSNYSPAQILQQLHKMISKALRQDVSESFDGMDVAFCQIEREKSGEVKIIFSGSNRPIHILRKGSPAFETTRGSRRTIGGVMPDIDSHFAEHTFHLQPGDAFLLNTDGFVDQNNAEKTKFSSARMLKAVADNIEKPFEQVGKILEASFEEFKGIQTQRDDATVVGIRIR